MKQLVFYLVVILTDSKGYEESREKYGPWANVNVCIKFSRTLSTQHLRGGSDMNKWNKAFKMPLTAFCEPAYVDPETTEVYP
tara:strand:- start:243 stop:488 length:246 start_codon:yes stop_codon:yes gene_type:complete